MKHLIRYTAYLFCCWLMLQACQQEYPEIPDPAVSLPPAGKANIALVPTLGAEILQGTETEPMTRAQNLILTRLINRYHVVIIKKSDTKWIIDTLIIGKIDTTMKDNFIPARINVYDTSSLPVIRLALRPGTYKAGFFLNANGQDWNPLLKPGYVVAEKDNITPEDELPVAYTYKIQTSTAYQNYQCIMLNDEPFAGWTTFTVGKNDTLRQTGPLPEQKLTLNRRATRLRYVLKDTSVNATLLGQEFPPLEISNTAYYLKAVLNAPKTTPFCQGLNILGGGYYPRDTVCTSLTIYISTTGFYFVSPLNGKKYHLATPANSTYNTTCILMDEYYPAGLQCDITNIVISSQPEEPIFYYDGSISRTFKLNGVCGVIFEPSTREGNLLGPNKFQFYVEENKEADAVDLFDLFFELNPKALSQ